MSGMTVWHLANSPASVKSKKGVMEVLERYYFSVEIHLAKQRGANRWNIEMGSHGWPAAFRVADQPRPEDEDGAFVEGDEILEAMPTDESTQIFGEMLGEFGPFLATPLTVQVVSYVEDDIL